MQEAKKEKKGIKIRWLEHLIFAAFCYSKRMKQLQAMEAVHVGIEEENDFLDDKDLAAPLHF